MISTKGRYAIRLLLDLAQQPAGTPVPLEAIAQRQDISKKYLEAIVKSLVAGKLVKSSSGKGGGYSLTKAPEEYTIYDILVLTESNMNPVACLSAGAEKCPREEICKTISMWRGYDRLTREYFSNITIRDLM